MFACLPALFTKKSINNKLAHFALKGLACMYTDLLLMDLFVNKAGYGGKQAYTQTSHII